MKILQPMELGLFMGLTNQGYHIISYQLVIFVVY